MPILTEDINPKWLNPIRRMQAALTRNQGVALITITIFVKGTEPMFWLEPQVKKVEPKGGADQAEKVLAMMLGADGVGKD